MSPSSARPSDRFIPFYIAAFFMLLMTAMGIFVYIAMHNYPGEVVGNPYKEGLKYNHTIEEAEAQAKLGWKSDLQFSTHGQNVTVNFTLTDKNGKPVTGAATKAWFIRPTHAGHDVNIALTGNSKGLYSGIATLAWKGDWEVHVSATVNGNNYQQVKEFDLK